MIQSDRHVLSCFLLVLVRVCQMGASKIRGRHIHPFFSTFSFFCSAAALPTLHLLSSLPPSIPQIDIGNYVGLHALLNFLEQVVIRCKMMEYIMWYVGIPC